MYSSHHGTVQVRWWSFILIYIVTNKIVSSSFNGRSLLYKAPFAELFVHLRGANSFNTVKIIVCCYHRFGRVYKEPIKRQDPLVDSIAFIDLGGETSKRNIKLIE